MTTTVSGSLILPSPTSGRGPTLLEYIRPVADELGFRDTLTVRAIAESGQRRQVVLLNDFEDHDVDPDAYAGFWLYVLDGEQAGTQVRVLDNGFYGPLGGLLLSPPLLAPLEVETSVELTWPLPVRRQGAQKGLRDLINEAGRLAWVEARLQMMGNGTRLYPLSAFPWLQRMEQTNGIYTWYGQDPHLEPSTLSNAGYTIRTDGATARLETDIWYGQGIPFELAVFAEANRLIKSPRSDWGYVTSGFVSDADQGAAPLDWIVPLAVYQGLVYLSRQMALNRKLPPSERSLQLQDLTARRAVWAQAAASVVALSLPRPIREPNETMVGPAWTPSQPFAWDYVETIGVPPAVVP